MATESELAKAYAEKIKQAVTVQMMLGRTMKKGDGLERIAEVLLEVETAVNGATKDPAQKRRILEEAGRAIGVRRPTDFPDLVTESSNQQQIQNSNSLSDFINQMRNPTK